jgi:hypothetical protein
MYYDYNMHNFIVHRYFLSSINLKVENVQYFIYLQPIL